MKEKTLKFCRYLAGAAMVMSALGAVLGNDLGFDSLDMIAPVIFAISCLLMAGALLNSNVTLLGVGCGVRAVYLVFYVILYIKWEIEFSYILKETLQAIGFVLLAVSLLQKKENSQLILIALAIGIIGSGVGYLFETGIYFVTKLSNCVNSISNAISWNYLPILLATLALGENNLPTSVNPVVVSPVQTVGENSIERIVELKELLDVGAITQEEFDLKKKELLNL